MTASVATWPATNGRNLYDAEPEELLVDFEACAPSLFETDEEVNVTIRTYRDDIAVPPETFHRTKEIVDYTTRPKELGTTRIISIPKPFSDSELEISKGAVQVLFTYLSISPGFWSVVKQFGGKDLQSKCNHESSGGFNEEAWDDFSKSYAFSYSVKHVEHHGRETYDPWSIRQIGVHHQYDDDTQENTFILLNPSKALSRRLHHITATTEPIEVHRLILASVTEQWNDYLAYLEYRFDDLSRIGLLSDPTRHSSAVGVRFSDSQRIQKLQDTIFRVSQMLSLNLSVFAHIISSPNLFPRTAAGEGPAHSSHGNDLSTLRTQTQIRQGRADNLLRRLDGSSALVRLILDAQSLTTLQASSRTTAELAALAREDSKKATKDARTLNTITLLGFFYLPASFVATLLSTNYIHVNKLATGSYLDGGIWIFLVLTVILLILTIGGWTLWERRSKLADRREEERMTAVASEKGA